jgi:hypothetical protein
MKKLIRNLEKNTAYDSDDEKNPYASSVRFDLSVDIPSVDCCLFIGRRGGRRRACSEWQRYHPTTAGTGTGTSHAVTIRFSATKAADWDSRTWTANADGWGNQRINECFTTYVARTYGRYQ